MEKVLYLLWAPEPESTSGFAPALRQACEELSNMPGVRHVEYSVVDVAVAEAAPLRLVSLDSAPAALVGVWLDAVQGQALCLTRLQALTPRCWAYLVTESEVTPNRRFPAPLGQRTHGMNQVVLLRRPEALAREDWLNIWQNDHARVAVEIQSTFAYRQNVVVRVLTADSEALDAIVEEQFPPEAMTDPHAFYAVSSEADYQQRLQIMIRSCSRFIDFQHLDCLPMSHYRLR